MLTLLMFLLHVFLNLYNLLFAFDLQDEEQFRRAVWGFDGGDEAETARVEGGKTAGGGGGGGGGGASAGSGGDAMDVDAGKKEVLLFGKLHQIYCTGASSLCRPHSRPRL